MEYSSQTTVFAVSIVELNKQTMICGMAYNLDLLKQPIIRSLSEIGHNFALKNPNWVRPVALERRFGGLLHDRK